MSKEEKIVNKFLKVYDKINFEVELVNNNYLIKSVIKVKDFENEDIYIYILIKENIVKIYLCYGGFKISEVNLREINDFNLRKRLYYSVSLDDDINEDGYDLVFERKIEKYLFKKGKLKYKYLDSLLEDFFDDYNVKEVENLISKLERYVKE